MAGRHPARTIAPVRRLPRTLSLTPRVCGVGRVTTSAEPMKARQSRLPRAWFITSVVGATLGAVGSVIGLIGPDRIYGQETPDLFNAGIAQDLVNLFVVSPMVVVLAVSARRDSLRSWFALLGFLAFTAYNYAIYCLSIQFGPLFLMWVAVSGAVHLQPARRTGQRVPSRRQRNWHSTGAVPWRVPHRFGRIVRRAMAERDHPRPPRRTSFHLRIHMGDPDKPCARARSGDLPTRGVPQRTTAPAPPPARISHSSGRTHLPRTDGLADNVHSIRSSGPPTGTRLDNPDTDEHRRRWCRSRPLATADSTAIAPLKPTKPLLHVTLETLVIGNPRRARGMLSAWI
ncbi:hypothetical protein QFZ26_002407 [Agromyces ramosus]|uniref:DUF4386 family protein n=1 Tax=Agromyces ramosus TaxID=33879 RepID=A0ABU0RAQ6_9MICO|nr:hypothetical protein [Agromyces ramosus]